MGGEEEGERPCEYMRNMLNRIILFKKPQLLKQKLFFNSSDFHLAVHKS